MIWNANGTAGVGGFPVRLTVTVANEQRDRANPVAGTNEKWKQEDRSVLDGSVAGERAMLQAHYETGMRQAIATADDDLQRKLPNDTE